MERSTPITTKPDYSFQIMLPNEWDNQIAKKNFGVSAIVETDICSTSWVHACQRMDHVIVPSTFAKQVLLKSGLKTKKVSVIPESYLDECAESSDTNFPLPVSTPINFLMLGQMSGDWQTDRKNTAQTIALFCDVFQNRPDVGLIVKTNSGTNSTIDRNISRQRLQSIVEQCRKGPGPRIYFLHGYLNNDEIVSLYQNPKVRCLLSLTHGEGFGLPLLEAAACGLPVIATNWSAHTEFLNLGKWKKILTKLETIPDKKIDNSIFIKNAKWANIDLDHAATTLEQFTEQCWTFEEEVKPLRKLILQKYSFQNIATKYDNFLKRRG
jgi:glycosyltransferase involved in cell wall biosynthesis